VLHDVWGEAAAGEMQVCWPRDTACAALVKAALHTSCFARWQCAACSVSPDLIVTQPQVLSMDTPHAAHPIMLP
jgi:hypothetical protein